MKCPECVSEDKRSTIQIGTSVSTAMHRTPYFDEDGEYHNHDPNYTTTEYSCSNGHKWKASAGVKACWCGIFG